MGDEKHSTGSRIVALVLVIVILAISVTWAILQILAVFKILFGG